ncbi:MAG: hypothetical protein G8D61_09450 [gamma proteobacterium symbiont of Ctena orbiculata]|nr:hypothetical protein [Candidatus Thiodiazotropha sp. (ex Lucina pensylvanica)]
MCKSPYQIIALTMILLSGCANQYSLTKEEMAIQNRADAVVSNVLFEHELDEMASYNVRKDGFLVVKFAKSVPSRKYTQVVEILRSSPDIKGVRAEQGGREVCKLTGYR